MDSGGAGADQDALRYLSRGKRRILHEVMTTRHGGGEAGFTTIGFDFDKKRMSVDPSSSSPPKSHPTGIAVAPSMSSIPPSSSSSAVTAAAAVHNNGVPISMSMSHGINNSINRKRQFSDTTMSINNNGNNPHELSVSHGSGTPLKRRSVGSRSITPLRSSSKVSSNMMDHHSTTMSSTTLGSSSAKMMDDNHHHHGLSAVGLVSDHKLSDENMFSSFITNVNNHNGGGSSSSSSSDHPHHYQHHYHRWNETMDELKRERDGLKAEVFKLRRQMAEMNDTSTEYRKTTHTAMIKLVRSEAETERLKRQAKVLSDNERIGRIVEQHVVGSSGSTRGGIRQLWEDGTAFKDMKRRKLALTEEKNELTQCRKELTKARKDAVKELTELTAALTMSTELGSRSDDIVVSSTGNSSDDSKSNHLCGDSTTKKSDDEKMKKYMTEDRLRQISIEIEISKLRSSQLNRELTQLSNEESQLENERKLHVKASRLLMEEKRSYVEIGQVLNERYVMINLLGKGGFSEVYRAYDLDKQIFVACKIHQLNSQWSDERKKNYSKHAAREYDIHKKMEHNRIVKLYDVFGIDISTFCTVLEYCDGFDLDIYLRMNQMLSEKESRCIMAQVFDALYYLSNECTPSIIHYDLKPGNILYHKGYAKITDFGLAKMIDVSVNDEMELTSQGAGTYWYLPPECFTLGMNPPMISTAVDIFSAGVVFYQLLFGQRPFGDSMSQDRFAAQLKQSNMVETVSFPLKPIVSDSVKLFIQECLNSNPKLRPTAKVICYEHPYFAHFRSI